MKLFLSPIIILLSSITVPTDPGDIEGQDEDEDQSENEDQDGGEDVGQGEDDEEEQEGDN